MKRIAMVVGLLVGCAKPVDRGPEIDALKAQVAALDKAMAATKDDVHGSTKSILVGLKTIDLIDEKGGPLPHWWCVSDGACMRYQVVCDGIAMNAGRGKCIPRRTAYCAIDAKHPCWQSVTDCARDMDGSSGPGNPDRCYGVE